jgi:hypothetical protein
LDAHVAAELVSAVNVYVSRGCPAANIQPDGLRLQQAAAYITRILAVLGLSEGLGDTPGFWTKGSHGSAGDARAVGAAFNAFAADVRSASGLHAHIFEAVGLKQGALQGLDDEGSMDRLAEVRDAVKRAVQGSAELREIARGVMAACDDVRDRALPKIGVKLEDRAGGAVWMLDDPAELLQEVRCTC